MIMNKYLKIKNLYIIFLFLFFSGCMIDNGDINYYNNYSVTGKKLPIEVVHKTYPTKHGREELIKAQRYRDKEYRKHNKVRRQQIRKISKEQSYNSYGY